MAEMSEVAERHREATSDARAAGAPDEVSAGAHVETMGSVSALLTETQRRRLAELGVDTDEKLAEAYRTAGGFEGGARGTRMAAPVRGSVPNAVFQRMEKHAVNVNRRAIRTLLENTHEPALCRLQADLAACLEEHGFTQVVTPTVISATQLDRMSIDADNPLRRQVFWLDGNACLRPMLAPGLYTVSRKLMQTAPLPLRVFEIGSCFRRESEGRTHLSEFTMLDLVEWGTPLEERTMRLRELDELVLEAAGMHGCRTEEDNSVIYGKGLDAVDAEGLELASSSMGPHPLDPAWGIDCTWVGIGFGLERLLQSREHRGGIHPYARSVTYLDGAALNIR